MGMPAPQPVSTIEELLALPEDGLRHELLDGEHVVTPAPRLAHQAVVDELLMVLGLAVLAIEVLSPGTASRDQLTKRRIYQRAEVAEYWIVDPDARLVERWTTDDERPAIADGSLTWRPADDLEVTLDLADTFGRALGT